MNTRPQWIATLALVSGLGLGCAQSSDEEMLPVSCEGKCDGWDTIRSLWADPKRLDLGDLLSVVAGFATDELNSKLVTQYGRLKLGDPRLYALADRAQNDLTLGNLDTLASGLAARFGERELTSEVNAVRRDYLRQSPGAVFGESFFQIDSSVGHNWSLATGGLQGVTASLGFDLGARLEARVIAAYRGELSATVGAPLQAIRDARGFVLPRTLADIKSMQPGESFVLAGHGQIGLNFGVGVPILVAHPASWITYSLVLSAGLRTVLQGDVDVQLVRLGADQVVVDVGIENATLLSARLALDDAWGVQGLLKSSISLGPINLNLGRLVEKALQDKLNATLNLISARAENASAGSRISVARVRFSLDADGAEDGPLARSLAQMLRGDIRLAQALANRAQPGVMSEFDLSRSGVSSTSYAGIDLFGMSFFREVTRSDGSVTIQTPGGARTILFNSLHKASGWFFSSHGYTRVGLSGLVFDPKRPGPEGVQSEANLFLQIEEGDAFMERDKLLDHLDGVILGLAGPDALSAIEGPGNQLERTVEAACPNSQAFDPCRVNVLSDPRVIQLRQDGMAALEGKLGALEPGQADLVRTAGRLRLTAQATYEPHAAEVGPQTSIVLDYRLDEGALKKLLGTRTGVDLQAALVGYLDAERITRQDSPQDIASDRAQMASRNRDTLSWLGGVWDDYAARYQKLLAVEGASIGGLGGVGPRALEIRFTVDNANSPVYEQATSRSVSQARAQTATALFDRMMSHAGALGPHAEQSLAYALLAMTPAAQADVRLDIKMDLSDNWAQSFEQYRAAGYQGFDRYTRGSAVSPIDGGMFNVDALLRPPQ